MEIPIRILKFNTSAVKAKVFGATQALHTRFLHESSTVHALYLLLVSLGVDTNIRFLLPTVEDY